MKTYKQLSAYFNLGPVDMHRPIGDIGNMKSPYPRPAFGLNATATGPGLGTYKPINLIAKTDYNLSKDDISTDPINSPKIKKKEKKEYNVNPDNDVPRQKWTDVKKKLKGRDSSQRSEERNYRNEYDNYHKKPVQRERNAARLRARRLMDRWGKVKRFDNKDIHHKDNNPLNNEEDNLAVTTQKWNRTEPRLRLTKFIKGK